MNNGKSNFPFYSVEGLKLLEFVYGEKLGKECYSLILELLPEKSKTMPSLPLSEKDSFLITYGDSFNGGIKELNKFAKEFLSECGISYVHVLPFFPYSSDDGFSIIDYTKVNKELGNWDDLESLGKEFKLCADIVLNHCSKSHEWFLKFLKNEEKYRDYFISLDPSTDTSMIVRPRALPLLSEFTQEGKEKPIHVWTTFSDDQVDLNFGNPGVLVEFVKILLLYIARGIRVIRLDAIAYVWKELGHPSIHHVKTHAIVKILRCIINEYYPEILLLSETNVPHEENISYLGNTRDEAQMIYQFSLPPLTLYSFVKGDVTQLRKWARIIERYEFCTYFNFLASHDGVGVTPLKGYVEGEELETLLKAVKERGGRVSQKNTKMGTIPYELNINYRDAVCEQSLEIGVKAKKFLASQAILLSVVGVPAIYIHSLIGSGNYQAGVKESGIFRRINREKVDFERVKKELRTKGSLRNLIFTGYKKMLLARAKLPAFHPCASQKILDIDNTCVFALERKKSEKNRVLCLINVTGNDQIVGLDKGYGEFTTNVLSSGNDDVEMKSVEGGLECKIEPFGVMWLKREQ